MLKKQAKTTKRLYTKKTMQARTTSFCTFDALCSTLNATNPALLPLRSSCSSSLLQLQLSLSFPLHRFLSVRTSFPLLACTSSRFRLGFQPCQDPKIRHSLNTEPIPILFLFSLIILFLTLFTLFIVRSPLFPLYFPFLLLLFLPRFFLLLLEFEGDDFFIGECLSEFFGSVSVNVGSPAVGAARSWDSRRRSGSSVRGGRSSRRRRRRGSLHQSEREISSFEQFESIIDELTLSLESYCQ